MQNTSTVYDEDSNGRDIRATKLINVQVVGQKYYPDITLFSYSTAEFCKPIVESIMSIPYAHNAITSVVRPYNFIEKTPVFFFIYNVDNYYHFLYDTLPYLITYKTIKKIAPEVKLLISCANSQQHKLNQFVIEFLELLDISQPDLVFANDETLYRTMYVSSSYTHDNKSNLPPRQEVYKLYQELSDKIECNHNLPRKIYVSRRSHKHGQYNNIGTNYTSKRMLVNEDELVNLLEQHGYTEVFTELLNTKEKIALFKNATHVVGPIGGGLCNVLFSSPGTKLIAIISPHFLDINSRFCYSFANVDTMYFKHTSHVEESKYKKFMRVYIKHLNLIGEIVEVEYSILRVLYSTDTVAGWNAQTEYKSIWVPECDVEIIDPGLNSAWKMDMNQIEEIINV